MSIVAEFVIPADAVPGGKTLEAFPDANIQLERIVPTSETALPFFWVFGAEAEAFLNRFKREPEIDDAQILTEVDYGALFKATWAPEARIVDGIKTLRATIIEAYGAEGKWTFKVRARDRRRLATFQQIFSDEGIPVELRRIYDYSEMVATDRPLTPEQRETLRVAYEEGYFEQPRGITQEELGERFGISGRAVSNRLRRGTSNLIASSILDPTEGNSP